MKCLHWNGRRRDAREQRTKVYDREGLWRAGALIETYASAACQLPFIFALCSGNLAQILCACTQREKEVLDTRSDSMEKLFDTRSDGLGESAQRTKECSPRREPWVGAQQQCQPRRGEREFIPKYTARRIQLRFSLKRRRIPPETTDESDASIVLQCTLPPR